MVDGCGANLAKYLLLMVNACVWMVGFVLIIVGMIVIVQSDKYDYLFSNQENTLATAAGIVIGTGCFIFLIGFCACCGAMKEVSCLLQAYFALIVIVIVLEVTAGILAFVYRDGLSEVVGDTIDEAIASDYDGDENAATAVIDLLQKEFKCCGRTGISEWATSAWIVSNPGIAPTSCCKRPKEDNCNTNVANMNTEGCEDAFKQWFNSNYLLVGGICISLLVFEILALVFTCCLLTTIKKEHDVA